MASVLGKRTRSASTTYGTRSKRVQKDIHVHKDDQMILSPTAVPSSITKSAVKNLESLGLSTPSKSRTSGRPAKHGINGARVSTISKGIDAHFGISKASTDYLLKKNALDTPPITPRHRDSATKKPVTPQTRVLVPGSILTPRTPLTPSTVTKASPYAQVRQLFTGCSEHGLLVGRQDERQQVTDFVSHCLDESTGGCLYVSGPPGTGKSAFIGDIIQQADIQSKTTSAVVNCMSIRNAAELTQNLATEFSFGQANKRKMDANTLKKHFTAKAEDGQMLLLVLDEVDQLVDLDLNLLYSLFEWSMQPSSNLILIGIANALDLTDRLLPRLKSRNIKPSLLPFMPYTATQINDIITTKLKSLNISDSNPSNIPFVQPAAILLCSKKVASQTGDLRKAFDIIKRALTLAENEARTSQSSLSPSKSPCKTPLSENVNLASPPIAAPIQTKLTALCHLTPETAPKATIAHVAKVTSQIFSNGMSSRLSQLNIQQKAVLCTLAAFEKKARSSLSATLSSMVSYVPATPSKTGRGQKVESPTTKQLFDSYTELCKRENLLHALSSVEFRDVLSGLETLSLAEFVDANGKTGTLGLMTPTKTPSRKSKKNDFGQMSLGNVSGDERRVSSVVGFKELSESLSGPGSEILREILEG
ncbi:Cell division control protein 18 [Elsinoe australis]|uniref:Cell division control protein n=1 Tax=Elsinoe australis TaxID=40998 RepID=A0A2P8A4G1_9PEZI|nr:Cell division control protein 18 [Elsinoe australis]